MLIRFRESERVFSFAQLYWQTTQLLIPYRHQKRTAVVFGPISNEDPEREKQNVLALRKQTRTLSLKNLNVLDIASYQDVIARLKTERPVAGYNFDVLEEFTLPLINNGWFNSIYFRQPFTHSVGTMKEYETAQNAKRLHNIQIFGFM